jgi:hypothetical protein
MMSGADRFAFVDTAISGAHRRNRVMELEHFHPPGDASDCFTTHLRFTEDLLHYARRNLNAQGQPSVAGYPGLVYAEFVPFDFDYEEAPDKAIAEAAELVREWETRWDVPPTALRIYWSGMKGVSKGRVPRHDKGIERPIVIPDDVPAIRRAIERVDAGLVIIDPIMAFLSGGTDSYRDQDARRTLAALSALAEETGAAVVIVRHLNKSGGKNPVYRGGGSIGIIGAARSGMLVAKDTEDEDLRVLSMSKSNLAAPVSSLTFTLEEADNGAVRVEWLGESELTAAELLGATTNEQPSAVEAAEEFLRTLLADGPVAQREVQAAAREAGISMSTAKKAKRELGVQSVAVREEGVRGVQGWSWSLPEG